MDQLAIGDDGGFQLQDLELNVTALNLALEAAGAPVRLMRGRVACIRGVVPVCSIFKVSTEFQVDGIYLELAAALTATSAPDLAPSVLAVSPVTDLFSSLSEEFFVSTLPEESPTPP
jgi:hypothetical protein